MRINGNYEDVTADALYGRRQAFTKLPEDQETSAAPDKETPGVVYEKGDETSSKLYTSDGGMTVVKHNRASSGSRGNYSGQGILDEIDKYLDKGNSYVIWHSGNQHWVQEMSVEYRDGRPVSSKPIEGAKKYFNPDSINAALGLDSPKTMSVRDNQVLFERNSYYQFTGKDRKPHTVLSMGNSLSQGILGRYGKSTFDKEAADYAEFWDSLAKGITFGLEEKYSTAEIRKKLEKAGIQHGFFTVTVGNRSQTYYLSQNENVGALRPKESYDKYYNLLTSGRAFELDKFQPGQTVTIGGKDYVLKDDKSIDIEYGAELYSSGALK